MLDTGLVQIYTGDGKGKTTAAFGLALRAAGHGGKVLIYQFLKPPSLDSGERKAVEAIDAIKVEMLPRAWDMRSSFEDKEAVAKTRAQISKACTKLAESAAQKDYDIIILDEIVMTGRGATKELIALADLVTRMNSIRHPFDKGIKARKGIEY
jgi:cob(I)alamin adenosyltransferase